MRRNGSDTDGATLSDCRFCGSRFEKDVIQTHGSVVAIEDRFPVTPGHCLIVPRRHTPDWFSMSEKERRDAEILILKLKEWLLAKDETITGFNLGMNCGKSAGQTIFHAHIHLIPRRGGDTPNPTGGVRGVIPGKRDYGPNVPTG